MVVEDVYNVDVISLFYRAQPNKTLSAKKSLWVQGIVGLFHSYFCCKHNMHWQVETCDYLQISMSKILWKVVANKLGVVVCKSNDLDGIICIWELDDEPQCTFQISKAEDIFNYEQFCYSLP